MANLSTAHGRISITAESKALLVSLLVLHAFDNRYSDYPTNIYFDNQIIDPSLVKNDDPEDLYRYLMNDIEESDIELDFTGIGRWNFGFNMENIFDCLRLETYPRNKEKPRFLQNLADTVVHHDFTIAFSGVDMEEGVGFIQTFEFESKYTPYYVETLKEAYYALPYDNKTLKEYGFID